jgi:hypothetical protein
LLLGGNSKSDRRLMIFSVEVARYGDQTPWVARENAIDQQPQLQGLGGSPERGEEIALRPPARRAPLRAAELLPGYRAGTRRAQVQVDYIQPPVARQLDFRKQQRSIEADRLRLASVRAACHIAVEQRLHVLVAYLARPVDGIA